MAAAEKALWYIENHFASEVTLGDIAKAASVSPYHLSRLFQATTGWSEVWLPLAVPTSNGEHV